MVKLSVPDAEERLRRLHNLPPPVPISLPDFGVEVCLKHKPAPRLACMRACVRFACQRGLRVMWMVSDADLWLPTHLQVLDEQESLVASSDDHMLERPIGFETVRERASAPAHRPRASTCQRALRAFPLVPDGDSWL